MCDNKHLCVFGVLKTAEGLKIKEEMLEWLNPLYNVLCIEQDPPGTMFEYPAIKYALKLSIEMNEPVLYIHTKGAANKKTWYQTGVRNIWKNEFSNETHVNEMFNVCENIHKPYVFHDETEPLHDSEMDGCKCISICVNSMMQCITRVPEEVLIA